MLEAVDPCRLGPEPTTLTSPAGGEGRDGLTPIRLPVGETREKEIGSVRKRSPKSDYSNDTSSRETGRLGRSCPVSRVIRTPRYRRCRRRRTHYRRVPNCVP